MRPSIAATALVGVASASPAPFHFIRDKSHLNTTASTGSNLTKASIEPCAQVSEQWQQSTKGIVDADLAYQCLQSVPLDAKGAEVQMEGIKFFVQFQSTLAYLKDPPEGYLYPGSDILGALDQISDNLSQSKYSNEHDFQTDVHDVVASAYDGHFTYVADINNIFGFVRNISLYSISRDSIAPPEVYLEPSPLFSRNGTARNTTSSPVVSINGEEVQEWMETAALRGNNQDPDANYNFLTPSVPQGSTGGFAFISNYVGHSTTVTFLNGTTVHIGNHAVTLSNFTGVVDGPSFFQKFCTPEGKNAIETQTEASPSSNTSSVAPIIPTTAVPFMAVPSQTGFPGLPGFSAPYIISDDGIIAGYFPEEEPDLAVLTIASFLPADLSGIGVTQFSNVVWMFLASAQTANKSRLVIDLRDNGGGQIPLAYDLFAQLFPSIQPYGATNFRAVPILDDLGQINSDFYSNVTESTATLDDCDNTYSLAPWNYRIFNDMNNREFGSWDDFYGPEEHHGDNFTSLIRYDLTDKFAFGCSANISNHGDQLNITPPVFKPENVLLVQNGICGSTCAIFSEFMKLRAQVKQVVFGGSARKGPMQAVGAVKGAQIYTYGVILDAISDISAEKTLTPAQTKTLEDKYGDVLESAKHALSRAAAPELASVNVRNNIREGDQSATPLQFVYEAADCRLFFTREMYARQELIWLAAYDAIWRGAACVEGSRGHSSSISGVLGMDAPSEDAY